MNDEEQKPVVVDVRRGSWWESRDGRRTMVVMGIYYSGQRNEAAHYEISERGRPEPLLIDAKVFGEEIKLRTLRRIW